MRPFLYLVLGTLVLFCGCEDKSTESPPATDAHLFSFEDGMEQWQARGIDLELGDTLLTWSIRRTQEMAKAGSTAVKFYLENWNDLVYQDHTGNGSSTDVGYRWLKKSYTCNVTTAAEDEVYVIVGIWGTWETPRTYYLDSLSILFTKKI